MRKPKYAVYEIQEESSADRLSDLVCRQIEAGWEPYGNPFTYKDEHGNVMFCQATTMNPELWAEFVGEE